MSYATPQWATSHPTNELHHNPPMSSVTSHPWATPQSTNELRHTSPMSYATHHQWGTPTPGSEDLPDCPPRWARRCWWGARPPPWPGPAAGFSPSGSTLCSHQIIIRTIRTIKWCRLCIHYTGYEVGFGILDPNPVPVAQNCAVCKEFFSFLYRFISI
jgi:hypothetical protein